MSFGFSVGDFLSTASLIKDIVKCLRSSGGSASEYQELMRELDGLQNALTKIENLRGSAKQTPSINGIKVAALNCQYVLRNFLKKLEEYEKSFEYEKTRGLVVDSTKKVKYELAMKTEVQNLRTYLTMHTGSLNLRLLTEGLTATSMAANQAEHNQQVLMQRFDNTESALHGISDDISETSWTVRQWDEKWQDKECLDIMAWLSPLDFWKKQNDIFVKHQEGTGKWMLDSKEFNDWLLGSGATLWCPGIPGAGKTVLASIVVNYLHGQLKDDASVGVACIYCNYKEEHVQSPVNLVASLWAQLVQNGSLSSEVKDLYRAYTHRRSLPTLSDVSKILQSEICRYSKIFVVVDALDECAESNRSVLLKELRALQPTLNLLVTSRFLDSISNNFEGATRLEISASAEDVQTYVIRRISREQRLWRLVGEDAALRKAIVETVVGNSKKMFLLAQLHIDSLATKATRKAVKEALKLLPNDLSRTYDEAMQRIESQNDNDRQLAERVLYWISYALRPLTVEELQHALAVEPGESKLDEDNIPNEELLTSLCAGLVIVDKESNIIRLVHYTTQEYFNGIRAFRFPSAQTSIASTCLTYLSFEVFADDCYQTSETLVKQYALLDYAAKNWGIHAGNDSEEDVKSQALRFLSSTKVLLSSRVMSLPLNQTGLHLAAYFGLKSTIADLLKSDMGADSKDSSGRTPLSWAAEKGHEAVVKLLLVKDGVGPDSKDIYGQTPLSWAAENGREAVVKLLLANDRVDPDSKDRYGRTPLSWAARNGHGAAVKLLLAKDGVDPSFKSYYGQTPLSWAARKGHEAVVKLLLANDRVDPDSKDRYGQTPLSWAAMKGHEAVVKLLLANDRVDPDSKDGEYGQIPLSWAAEGGHEAAVKLLLANDGAGPDSKDEYGQTPLSWAAMKGHKAMAKLLLAKDKVSPDSKDGEFSRTPLSWAIESGCEAVVKLLLAKNGVEPDSKNSEYGRTPLLWAARDGHEAVVKLLLANDRVDPDSKDSEYGRTPLSWAAENGHEAVVKLLLANDRVDQNYKDKYGQTPLSLAVERGREAVVKLLLAKNNIDLNHKR